MSVYVIIPFHSTDYIKWKELFDEFASARDAWGAEGYVIYRGLDDPDAVASCTTSPNATEPNASSTTPRSAPPSRTGMPQHAGSPRVRRGGTPLLERHG